MTQPLVIENNFGEVVRTISWDGGVQLTVLRHLESGRIEVTSEPQPVSYTHLTLPTIYSV